MTDLSPEQRDALQMAHKLVDMGMPMFVAARNHGERGPEFHFPTGWQTWRPRHDAVDRWKPGMALCAVTGIILDVIDVDPRNGGREGIAEIAAALGWDAGQGARSYGQTRTPSGGEHMFIARTHLAKTSKAGRGVDLQAGQDNGEGRGFVYLPPTVRLSKWGDHAGQEVPYRWIQPPDGTGLDQEDEGLNRFTAYVVERRPARGKLDNAKVATASNPRAHSADEQPWDDTPAWTPAEARRVIDVQLTAVRAAREGEINNALGGAARVLGRFVAGGFLDSDEATARLTEALAAGGVHSDAWNVANRRDWTAATVIAAGMANGADEPWTVAEDPFEVMPAPAEQPADAAPVRVAAPRLAITSAADSAYWLAGALGSATLSGFFLRQGRIVHTPQVDESGYVEPRHADADNGPVQIQDVTPGGLAAKIQYLFQCYKTIKATKDTPEREVDALFPLQAAQRAIDAPEAMQMLRPLAGVTLTPMVRADGTVLEQPGYDPDSRMLFLPGQEVRVGSIPLEPSETEVDAAVALLDQMTAGFPWETKDDRANYYGLLLTPLLRLVTPPTYKMFGIGAHQPGSGKTLLADIATILHGGVLRSEVPEDEAEWRKQATSILAGTSAPIVHIDNITGVLKSSVLAGLLTAGQATSDRILGTSQIVTTVNDRVWVVTGNNLSLGGDLVRRTIVINIDPNMANPETREFPITDLKAWVREHRNEVLRALLIMIRAWAAAGSPRARRAQSDSFADWEAAVGGILSVCRVAGDFDHESGKRAARGGDDDGLSETLAHLFERFGSEPFQVAEALNGHESAEIGDFVAENRDWLPSVVLDKLARSEVAGRKSFGYWLRNRLGRWVTDADGRSLVIREAGKNRMGAMWRIDRH